MNLRSQVLLGGLFLLFFQIASLSAFFYLRVMPQADTLEKTILEKNLHRGLAALQRELFHLSYLTGLLAELPLIQTLTTVPVIQEKTNKLLEEKMQMYGINVLDILSKDHKVLWEKMIDVNTGQTYLYKDFLPRLWQARPNFLTPLSVSNTEVGIYNSRLGPVLMVSAPIFLNEKKTIQGILLVGKAITPEVIRLIQSLTFATTTLFPLGDEKLSDRQQKMVQGLVARNAYRLIEESSTLLRGYTLLTDVEDASDLLISTIQPREFTQIVRFCGMQIIVFLIFSFFLFLGMILFLIRRKITLPLFRFFSKLKQGKEEPLRIEGGSGEIKVLFQVFSHFVAYQKNRGTQAAAFAYQKGTQEAYQVIIKNIQIIRHFVLSETAHIEKMLLSLPLNEIEWLLAQRRTQKSNDEEENTRWQNMNDKIRSFQKEMQVHLQGVHTQFLRMMVRMSEEARRSVHHALKKKAHPPYH